MPVPPLRYTLTVTQDHIDQNNHVNNVQYVHWVEEAAKKHWDLFKIGTPYQNDYWVLYDHHIQYRKQVFLGNTITVETFPLPPEGIKQPRKVKFYLDEQVVVESTTYWILMNGNTHKVKRLAQNWLDSL